MDARARRLGATEAEWNDWRWQLRHALADEAALARAVRLTAEERRGLELARGRSRVAATPYYASLMDPDHATCPVRMQVVPSPAEFEPVRGDMEDPLGEDTFRPAAAIVHRYRDRALLVATARCAVYCRHCTRRRLTLGGEPAADRAALAEAVAYVRAHPEIRDVIVSGGDPLVLSDERLDEILSALRAIHHVRIIRVATRAPAVLPMRVDDALASMLRRHAPLFVVTHFNHPKECTPEAARACGTLVDHGVPVENQSVLLRGVNSSARILQDLLERLLEMRVRPYYLHQGDLARGTGHFRTPVEAGVAVLEALRGRTSGLAIPHLAVDLPGGRGKVTLSPDYRLAAPPSAERGTWLRSYRGEPTLVPDPPSDDCACPYEAVYYGAEGSPRPAPEGGAGPAREGTTGAA